MPEATFTKSVPIPVDRAGIITIDLDTNMWSINLKIFRNNQDDTVTLSRTTALAALGDTQKAFFQTVIDTFQAAAVSEATGVTVTLNEIRASALAYKVDAAPPQED
jgi:hypothetical protein